MAISTINSNSLASGVPASSNMPTGSVLQVVNAVSSAQASTTGGTYVASPITATITPKFATSKILVLINNTEAQKSNAAALNRIKMNLCRNGSQVIEFHSDLLFTNAAGVNTGSSSFSYLDSPATTSATTYKTQFASNGGTGAVYVQNSNLPSVITLMEIAQ